MKNVVKILGEKIISSQNILLINHIRMDPDAFGSLTGLAQILSKMGKTVQSINDEHAPENFSFLGKNHLINPELDIKSFSPDLIISLDASSLDQLGNSYLNNKEIFHNTDFFVIDHHISNPGFGQYNIIKTDFSSTCEIVFEIIEELKLLKYIDSNISTCLFSGMITDTNIFYNQNTTPNTHRVAGELMRYGAHFRLPIFEFYKKKNFKTSKLWGEILKDIEQVKTNGKIITYAVVKQEYFEKTDTTDEDISGLINEFLSNMENGDVSFLLYPMKNGQVKASMRSGEIDVSKICQKFGGGGHKLAGGFSSDKNIYDVKNSILKELSQ